MTKEELITAAKAAGFARLYFAKPHVCEKGQEKLVHDPLSLYPWAQTVIFLLAPCTLAKENKSEREAVLSAYYPASQSAYKSAKALAERLVQNGCRAQSNVQIPIKPYLEELGCVRGVNSLIYDEILGSAFHAQTVLTDASFETDETIPFARVCEACGKCVSACPTGAIGKTGVVQEKCLRYISEQVPVPEKYEKLLGNRLLGCEICQTVCPMNAKIPRGEGATFPIVSLLRGEIEPLKQLIGPNVARKHRLMMKGCVLAANLNRQDLKEEIIALTACSQSETEKAAAHALERLK